MVKRNISSKSYKKAQRRKREKWQELETVRNQQMNAKLMAIAATGCDPSAPQRRAAPLWAKTLQERAAAKAAAPKPAAAAAPAKPVTPKVSISGGDGDDCVEIVVNIGQDMMQLDALAPKPSTSGTPLAKLKRPTLPKGKRLRSAGLKPKHKARSRTKVALPAK
eukprot:EG_transcript_27199